MKRVTLAVVLLAMVVVTGCSGMTRTQQTTLSGGAIGATGGAVLGAVVGGSPAVGAVVGGAAGAATGYIIGEDQKKSSKR